MFELASFPLDSIIDFTGRMLVFLAGLAALIFIHELGHFLFARRFGVEVEKFALGFGPKLIGFKSGATEYLIAAIPLGGYVKMKGEDPGEEIEDPTGSFSSAKVHHRLAIAFAGPLFNFLFAIAIYFFLYLNGVPTLDTTIGIVKDGSPASAAGLVTGDKIVEVDGKPVQFWDELLKTVHESPGKQMEFVINRKNALSSHSIIPRSEEITNLFGEKEKVGLIGIMPKTDHISYIKEGSAAEKAGLMEGDRLLKINSTLIHGLADLIKSAVDKPGEELTFLIERDGIEQEIKVTPEPKTIKDEKGQEKKIGLIGVGLSGNMIDENYGLVGALKRSVGETLRMISLIAVSIKKMVFGSIPADSIGGPIMIFQIYGEQAKQGFNEIILLTALLSINLGLLNLLPIPVLDGGHIFFFLIEMIKGRPVSEKNREWASQVGLFMLLSLMVFAFYNDIMRIIS